MRIELILKLQKSEKKKSKIKDINVLNFERRKKNLNRIFAFSCKKYTIIKNLCKKKSQE